MRRRRAGEPPAAAPGGATTAAEADAARGDPTAGARLDARGPEAHRPTDADVGPDSGDDPDELHDEGSTTARILRVISIAVGASSLLFLALLWLAIVDQWPAAATWWNALAVGWGIASAGAAIGVGIDGHPRRVRIVAGCIAVTYLAVTLLRIPAQDAALEPGEVVWFLNVAAIGVTAAATAFRPAIAISYLIVSGAVVGVVRWLCSPEHSALIGLQNAAQSTAFCVIFLVIALSLVGAGRSADRAMADARHENAAEASRRARRDVAERIDALVHDRVLATLLLAGRATNAADRDTAARSAADALDALARQRQDGDRQLSPTEFVWAAQGLVRDLDPETQFGYELHRDSTEASEADDTDAASARTAPPAGVPSDVADALAAAMLEALRNSLRHADRDDRPTTRAVHVDAGTDRVVVTVLDDGAGFDTSSVDPARIGIASSIRGRMHAICGTAQLVSVVGQGTRVVLTWDREAARAAAAANEAALAERPWRRRRRPSPLDLYFWIGPPPEQDAEAVIGRADGRTDDAGGVGQGAPGGAASTVGRDAADRPADARAPAAVAGRPAARVPSREARARRRLSRRIQREPLLVFAVLQNLSNVALAVTSDPALALTWPCVTALALYAVATGLAVLPNATPLRVPFAAAVVVATTGVSALMAMIVPADAEYFAWHYGANTLLLLGVALRGRIRFAWIGMLLMVVTTALVLPYATVAVLVSRFDRNIGVLLVGTIAALALKRTINRTLTIERARDARAARQAAHAAAAEEQERILRRFEASALPVLREIASGVEADEGRRRAWLRVEADLRDRIRARALDAEPLRGAIGRARERGVRVVVLDDAGGRRIPDAELPRASRWAAELVDAVRDGEVTVRLRSTGAGLALTVVADEVSELAIDAPAPAR